MPLFSVTVHACVFASLLFTGAAGAGDPFADEVISYVSGANPPPVSGYTNPAVTLGSPERFTGEFIFPSAVTPFNPAFTSSEIVSIGGGGSLVLRFDEPVTDDPDNPFGIDLLVFGNSQFIDARYPLGIVAGLDSEGGSIEVSEDGENWVPARGLEADGLFPTLGYLDTTAYAEQPGTVLSDFTRPVNPALTLDDFLGLMHEDVVALYAGSGGGTGIDLGALGLEAIQFLRITNAPGAANNIEIDAASDVAPAENPADLNLDGVVDGADLGVLLLAWGPCGVCGPDLNLDGTVDGADLGILLLAWTT
jgi:hypothetical protein